MCLAVLTKILILNALYQKKKKKEKLYTKQLPMSQNRKKIDLH